jgi:hypothetical protein
MVISVIILTNFKIKNKYKSEVVTFCHGLKLEATYMKRELMR